MATVANPDSQSAELEVFQALGRSLDRDKVSEIARKVPYIAIGVRRERQAAYFANPYLITQLPQTTVV
jgi:hypothetical protein